MGFCMVELLSIVVFNYLLCLLIGTVQTINNNNNNNKKGKKLSST